MRGQTSSSSASSRTNTACERCRKRHIKCDGLEPCRNCAKYNADCVYVEGEKKIVVSLRFLKDLKNENMRIRQELATATGVPAESSLVLGDLDYEPEVQRLLADNTGLQDQPSRSIPAMGPFVPDFAARSSSTASLHQPTPPPTTSASSTGSTTAQEMPVDVMPLQDGQDRIFQRTARYSGMSSMTALGLEIECVLPRNHGGVDLAEPSTTAEGMAMAKICRTDQILKLELFKGPHIRTFDITFELPPYTRALAAFTAYKTFLAGCFYFFNLREFSRNLDYVYNLSTDEDGVGLDVLLKISLVLQVLALGEMYVQGQAVNHPVDQFPTDSPPQNSNGFAKPGGNILGEIALFRSAATLTRVLLDEMCTKPSVQAVEVLLVNSFAQQVMDWMYGASIYSSLALRLSLLLGLHADLVTGEWDRDVLEHRRRIWWSAFHVDRYLSAKAGYPLSISESSILAALPQDFEGEYATYGEFPPAYYLNSFIEVTRITTQILDQLYQRQPGCSSVLLSTISKLMTTLGDWQDKWTSKFGVSWDPDSYYINRTSANIFHEFFFCVNLNIRPILYHFVRKRIVERHAKSDNTLLKTPNVIQMLQSALFASAQTVESMYYLLREGIFATFGYLDREYTFYAASTLFLFTVTFPGLERYEATIRKAIEILEYSESAGNIQAKTRKSQLQNLISTLSFLDGSTLIPDARNDDSIGPATPVGMSQKYAGGSSDAQSYLPHPIPVKVEPLTGLSIDKDFSRYNYTGGTDAEMDIFNEIYSEGGWWVSDVSEQLQLLINNSSD